MPWIIFASTFLPLVGGLTSCRYHLNVQEGLALVGLWFLVPFCSLALVTLFGHSSPVIMLALGLSFLFLIEPIHRTREYRKNVTS